MTAMAIVLERLVPGPPQAIQQRFAGDPARWLPGRITEHGGHEFHTVLHVAGITVPLWLHVDTLWLRGEAGARFVRVDLPERLGGLLPHRISGDLVVERREDIGVALQFTPTFDSAAAGGIFRMLGLTHLLGRAIARRLHTGIAERLGQRSVGDAPT